MDLVSPHNVDHIFIRYAQSQSSCVISCGLRSYKITISLSASHLFFELALRLSRFRCGPTIRAPFSTEYITDEKYHSWLIEGNYSPTSSPLELQYGDATSSIYPDRPIRPLPKRRLRSRLSAGAVDSILNPQSSISSAPLMQSPGKEGKAHLNGRGDGTIEQLPEHRSGQEKESYQFRGSDMGQDTPNGPHQPTAPVGIPPSRNGYMINRHEDARSYRQAHMPPPIAPSAASSGDSIDGYDSFENTNNKKKRKIPISGSLGNHSSLSTDMAHMDISLTRDIDASQIDPEVSVGQYYGSGSSAVANSTSHASGISGSGRGRFGRSNMRHYGGRSPLGLSFNGTNSMQHGRSTYNSKESPGGVAFGKPGNDHCTMRIVKTF